MQVGSASFQSPGSGSNHFSGDECAEIYGKLSLDFGAKLEIEEADLENQSEKELLTEEQEAEGEGDSEGEGEEEEEEDDDFSFVCLNPDGSLISADDAFSNGQIRPIFPLFNQDLLFAKEDDSPLKPADGTTLLRPPLRKLFIEGRDSTSTPLEPEAEGPYCEWSGRTVEEASPEACKKSNSTGFSKLWRFRDLVHRSNSDGKDAFVFLTNPSSVKSAKTAKIEKNENPEKKGKEKVKASGEKDKKKGVKVKGSKATASAAEKHYVKGRAIREGEKRKSYLPYRQDLVGFFTSVNGFSRNVHPF